GPACGPHKYWLMQADRALALLQRKAMHRAPCLARMAPMNLDADLELDASGLMCPLPLLKANLALNSLAPQQILKVTATDPGSQRDFKVFVQQSRHTMLSVSKDYYVYCYWIQKG